MTSVAQQYQIPEVVGVRKGRVVRVPEATDWYYVVNLQSPVGTIRTTFLADFVSVPDAVTGN